MRLGPAVVLLLACACATDRERHSLRSSVRADSSGRSSAEATLGADAPPAAVTSSVVGGDADAEQDVLAYLGRHLYQGWRPDSSEGDSFDDVCRLDTKLQQGLELRAGHGIVRARLLSLVRPDSLPRLSATFEALRVVSVEGDTAGGKRSTSRDMVLVGPVVDTMSLDFYRRGDGEWITCGPPSLETASGRFGAPLALLGPPDDTLSVRGIPSRRVLPAKSGWARVRALADSLGGQSAQAVLEKRVWAGAYVEPVTVTDMPQAVRDRLTQMRCMIPLAFRGNEREPLVERGAFYGAGRPGDWAVACSRTRDAVRESVLFVFGVVRSYSPDSVYALGRDVVKDDRHEDGQAVSTHELLFNRDIASNQGTLGRSVTAETRKDLDLTDSEASQPLHDGLTLNLDSHYRVYWTGARWVVIPRKD